MKAWACLNPPMPSHSLMCWFAVWIMNSLFIRLSQIATIGSGPVMSVLAPSFAISFAPNKHCDCCEDHWLWRTGNERLRFSVKNYYILLHTLPWIQHTWSSVSPSVFSARSGSLENIHLSFPETNFFKFEKSEKYNRAKSEQGGWPSKSYPTSCKNDLFLLQAYYCTFWHPAGQAVWSNICL